MSCKICGSETKVSYRERCRMSLCDSCYSDMPTRGSKASYRDFLARTFGKDDATARSFYSDYLTSREFDVERYWESCSSPI